MTPDVDKADWTILLFIAADGTLANFAVESLKQLEPASTPVEPESEHVERASTPAEPESKPGKVNVIAGAHFAFPIDTTGKVSAAAAAAGGGDLGTNNTIAKLAPQLAHMLVNSPETTSPEMTPSKMTPQETMNMSQKEALQNFLESAAKDPKFDATHHALVLWGHGPELLLQPAASDQTDGSNGMYITPEELREVLEPWLRNVRDHKLDIIGFDACFMSMLEMACEIRDCARYMVASQDEVPDASFPYAKLLALFRGHRDSPESVLKAGVDEYLATYGDYIFCESTGLNPITLSALQLGESAGPKKPDGPKKHVDGLKKAVDELASALLDAQFEPGMDQKLIQARNLSKDYASGLYVDLYEFCSNLLEQKVKGTVKDACDNVKTTLEDSSGLILKNVSRDGRSHGISLYLPFLTDDQYDKVNYPLVKGGDRLGAAKGFSAAINGAATEYLMCARRSMILDTESYYRNLRLASKPSSGDETSKSWYDFITDGWTKVLMRAVPSALDFHYSTQQALMNVNRKSIQLSKSLHGSLHVTNAKKSA